MAFTTDNGNLPPVDKHSTEQTRQRELMALVNSLSLAAMNTTLNERNLQEVRLTRAKMAKIKGNQSGNVSRAHCLPI
jgi:hypothetical protein